MELIVDSPKYGKQIILIDEEDKELVLKYKWRLFKRKFGGFYAVAWTPMINKERKFIRLHNLLMNRKFIDHINGNGLDNRRCNLRICTSTTNNQNKRSRGGESKYKGVYRNKQVKTKVTWMACIQVNKKHIHLGSFNTEIEAAIAYDNAAIKYFGEFAKLNIERGGLSDI